MGHSILKLKEKRAMVGIKVVTDFVVIEIVAIQSDESVQECSLFGTAN
jgi:hypothetical protein